jgi:beta-lactamase class A
MIVLSDNTATKLLVDCIGMPQINTYLKNAGIEDSAITDPTMLKEPPAFDNNRTTPLDMARLLKKIYHGEGFSLRGKKEMLSFMRQQRYRWGLWRGVPPGTVIADKTGNLEGILNDVGIVHTKQGNYILSVFTHGFKKQRDARRFINELSRAAYEEYTGEKVIQKQAKSKKTKKITKRRLRHRPSVKYQRRSGHRGAASGHKSRTYRRR